MGGLTLDKDKTIIVNQHTERPLRTPSGLGGDASTTVPTPAALAVVTLMMTWEYQSNYASVLKRSSISGIDGQQICLAVLVNGTSQYLIPSLPTFTLATPQDMPQEVLPRRCGSTCRPEHSTPRKRWALPSAQRSPRKKKRIYHRQDHSAPLGNGLLQDHCAPLGHVL